MNHILHRLGNASGSGKTHAEGRRLIIGRHIRDIGEVDVLGLQHPPQLLKGQYKVHITADGAAAGLQLFGGAGSNESHLTAQFTFFLQSSRKHHGSHSHRDIRRGAGELLLSHHGPRRAAGGSHIRLHLRYMAHEFLRFLDGAQVCAYGDLLHGMEAQHLHG